MFKEKIQASLFHLLLSAILVLLVIGSILYFFFPIIFIGISNFKEIAIILISVDLILGPLLTFVVFNKNKKSLKFDLSVIAAIQLSALLYGTYTLFQAHPVYITFNVDRFTIVNAKDAEPEKASLEEYKVSKFTAAKLAYAKLPDNQNELNKLIETSNSGGADLDQRVDFYESYEENISNIIAKGLDSDLLNSNQDKKIKSFINKHQGNIEEFIFLPLTNAHKDAIIVLDKTSAQPIATINTDPWKFSKK